MVEGPQILSFGCVEGRFVVRGDAVVYDPQGSLWPGFRTGGCAANRLALILNAEEILAMTGRESISDAATTLMRDEDAMIAVVKDGPRGARVIDAHGQERWIPPYHSSRLYKIGSGDVFSAMFAHWWLGGTDAVEAADRASRETAAYVDSPVLPLATSEGARPRRAVGNTQNVLLVAEGTTLTSLWLISIIEEALHHLGIGRVEKVEPADWLRGEYPSLPPESTAALICVTDRQTFQAPHPLPANSSLRQVIFLDEAIRSASDFGSPEAITDLSQALYELFWDPR
jgi:hypothetical protein